MRTIVVAALAAVLIWLFPSSAIAGVVVVNPGFETGDFTGWTEGGWYIDSPNAVGGPHSGIHFATTGCTQSPCWIQQDLTTTVDAAYTLTFWYNSGPGSGSDLQLVVRWGGAQIDDIVGQTSGWHSYSYGVTASSGTTTLAFGGLQVPSYDGLDDISVNDTVPEPNSILLLGGGIVALVLRRLWHR